MHGAGRVNHKNLVNQNVLLEGNATAWLEQFISSVWCRINKHEASLLKKATIKDVDMTTKRVWK